MSRAVVCAALAGVLAAVAVVDLALARRGHARPRRTGSAVALLARLGRRVRPPAAGDLALRLAAAGTPFGLTPADLAAVKAGAGLVGLLAGLPFVAAAPGRTGLLVLVAAPAGAHALPDVWLRRRAARRAERMARELPDVMDLLRVAVDAGLPVTRAVGEVGRRHAGELAAELRATATAVELGVGRADALAALADRAPLPAVAALTAAVDRTERHGAPLAPALAALSVQARADRARALTEAAARAAPKIQLAVALLLVPSALLLVAAGAVAAFVPHA